MSKQKSFNVDEGAHLKRCVATGATIGIFTMLLLLPAVWRWLEAWIVDIVVTLTSFGAAAAPELPEAVFQNPLEALPELIGDDAFLAGCAATLAVSMAAGIWSHLDWSRWLHDGTWVGGRRAPGAPIHGDARLISAHGELKRRSESWQEGKRPSGGTLVVGEIGKGVRLIDSVHACILAESGEGKSRRVAVLSAMANFEQGRSLLINDIKGELRAFLEPMFEKAGTHRIVDVMFDAPASSIRFDPLERAKESFRAEGAGGCARELRELARCVVPAPSKGQPFFYDGARNLFVGISLALIEGASIPEDEKTIMSVAAAISPSGDQGPLDRIAALAASLPAGDPALPFLGGLNGEHGGGPGIVSTLSNCLAEYVDGNVARMLHNDECGLGGIGEEPTVVFISSSSATGNYKRLVQTFVSQALSALRSCAAGHAGRCPVETVLLLDEAASLGRNERIVQDLGEMRSEGIRVLWFCQSLLQLQSVSGYSREEAETILDLLKDKVVLSCSNLDTARKLSESMGSYTAIAQSTSRTKGANTGSTGTSEGLVRRPLITPDELQRWTGRETGALVIHDGVPMAFPSRDVTETFVGPMLGMTSPDAERTLMEQSVARRETRNQTVPKVWNGPAAPDATAAEPARAKTVAGYVPEGF
ncbi:type IV secretory system conjugative DNA transfer family protein [uncultured Collinsella sp.]|uniref:type IV secretory system conjugative DNA transfer family protein n=1 Tax=uncultured Collinsella sp. TaxID=165190 RepID=UPI0025D61082|nr:type IV secretory system conjugative DNA transfer family protein [uncultured Collinsella sp.]